MPGANAVSRPTSVARLNFRRLRFSTSKTVIRPPLRSLSGDVRKRIVRAAPEALMKVPTNLVRLPAWRLVDCAFMALPRPPPLAESIRLHRQIFHHLRSGPALGAKGEASNFSMARAFPLARPHPPRLARGLCEAIIDIPPAPTRHSTSIARSNQTILACDPRVDSRRRGGSELRLVRPPPDSDAPVELPREDDTTLVPSISTEATDCPKKPLRQKTWHHSAEVHNLKSSIKRMKTVTIHAAMQETNHLSGGRENNLPR